MMLGIHLSLRRVKNAALGGISPRYETLKVRMQPHDMNYRCYLGPNQIHENADQAQIYETSIGYTNNLHSRRKNSNIPIKR